ncbi:unnamed protein product [Allacma fusca]|uniref:C2H2-type domain-containing protein n=1 Tax=Allacma fusca TaxID=39272 RepID=A0A8J2KRP8_9HEXA|nr:unnamed protein product [Allacma fusca]
MEGRNTIASDFDKALTSRFSTQPKIWLVDGTNCKSKSFKITLQPETLALSGNDCICPVVFCQKKIPKNRSIEEHIRGHLVLILQEVQVPSVVTDKFEVIYHCPELTCKYSDAKNLGYFSKLKYLKQHYLKIHAPKHFKCSTCQKTFAALSYLRGHQAMCGKLFVCSCNVSYTTLEALQTHARRKEHTFDFAKYKEILSAEKSKIADTKILDVITEKIDAPVSSKERPKIPKPYPLLLPKSSSTPVFDVFEITSQPTLHLGKFICEVPTPKTTIDFGTQTVPHHHNSVHSSNTLVGHASSNSKKSSTDIPEIRLPKRKKSAETQTARVRVRISTETQTTNVVKRRRSMRKQQSVEAQTQCHQELNQKTVTAKCQKYPPLEIDPILKDDSMANPISEFEGDSFFREMEEVHIQTQTEPDLLLGGENVFSDYDVHVNMSDSDVSSFLNFVTAETQTAHTTPSANSWSSTFMESNKTETDINSGLTSTDDHLSGSMKTVTASYLETMDNETQTQFYDFGAILSKMFE